MTSYDNNKKTISLTEDSNSNFATINQDFNTQHSTPKVITNQPDAIKAIKYAKTYEVQAPGPYQNFLQKCGTLFGYFGVVPVCCCSNPYEDVNQGYVGLITRFGELSRVVDPGSVYINRMTEHIYRVSIKTEVQEIPEQACLTKDNVIVYLKSVIYYNIVDPQKAVFSISNIHDAISEKAQTTLRDVIGARVLQDVIERREQVAEAIQAIITSTAYEWGVSVDSILIKDLRLSAEISQALSQAAQAKRIGESKIIQAKSEVEASRLMRESAKLLNSKVAVQMRYLDAMVNMAKTANSKVIFMPTSVDIDQKNDSVDDNDFGEEDVLTDIQTKAKTETNNLSDNLMNKLALQEGFTGAK